MSWRALKKRYLAGIEAVKDGADPYETFYLVLEPTEDVELATSGELPQGYRMLTEAETREIQNERNRRYREPMQKKWDRAA